MIQYRITITVQGESVKTGRLSGVCMSVQCSQLQNRHRTAPTVEKKT